MNRKGTYNASGVRVSCFHLAADVSLGDQVYEAEQKESVTEKRCALISVIM